MLSLVHTFHSDWTNYSFDRSVRRYEEREIRRALEDAGGNISQAARLLGLTHQRLHQILKNRHKNLRHVLVEIIASEQESDADEDPISDLNESVATKAQSVRILHVEDSEIVAGIAKEMLEHQGWQVETCADGNAALEKISGEGRYDLLLIDYDLPGVNGLELVRCARNLAHRSRTPMVMLSASPVEAAAREAGANVFLLKPRDVGSLIETITRLLEHREHEA